MSNRNAPFYDNVSSKYGAPMGRQSCDTFNGIDKVRVERVPFSDGCYDPGGTYWGGPCNLYCTYDTDHNALYLRATSRDDAKKQVLKLHKNVTFYR